MLSSTEEIDASEKAILRYIQRRDFSEEFSCLENSQSRTVAARPIRKASRLYKLDPFLHDNLIVVGGRLSHAELDFRSRHPIIVPKTSHVAQLIIDHVHQTEGHQGREHVLASLRQKYWIPKANVTVRSRIAKCTTCRRVQAATQSQKMSDLPLDRVSSDLPPFTSVGTDFFGPFFVKRGRGQAKRYGVIFTCLGIRAVHIEIAHSLTTDGFIQALRRFQARRGQVREIRSDNATNLTGGEKELRSEIQKWNQNQIHDRLLQRNIKWTFNAPGASHHGGVWERQIRTIRKIFSAILGQQSLDDESLSTLMCEIESIINNRPITAVSSDPNDLQPLTPNMLLLMKSEPTYAPGTFPPEELYARKRWKQVQQIADQFWFRWKREYLLTLQQRQKWIKLSRNMMRNDIVLVMHENLARNAWPLGRVMEVYADSKGVVRVVLVRTKQSLMKRPVHKLVLLQAADGEPFSRS